MINLSTCLLSSYTVTSDENLCVRNTAEGGRTKQALKKIDEEIQESNTLFLPQRLIKCHV